jgi:threonine dehydratase
MSTTQSPELTYRPIPLDEIEAARARTAGAVIRSPLVRLDVEGAPAEIYLKLECLQPIRSFKLRGAFNAMAKAGREALKEGVWTASAGNMAQGVAWAARYLGVPCTVVLPVTAPETKIAAIERYGGKIVKVPYDDWMKIFFTRTYPGMTGVFVHAFSDEAVMAGNGVVGLEILEDLPDVDAVVVPWGGGGLCCGVASAIRAVKPSCKVYACEIDTGAPLGPSLAAGRPVEVPFAPNFVDGIGDAEVLPEMFELARNLVDGSVAVSLQQTADAARLIMERTRVIPEGAGAAAPAAGLAGLAGGGKVVCIVSGGNIDAKRMITILQGGVPA